MTAPSTRVPAAMQDKFNAIAQAADAFCDQRLNDDYKHLIRLGGWRGACAGHGELSV